MSKPQSRKSGSKRRPQLRRAPKHQPQQPATAAELLTEHNESAALDAMLGTISEPRFSFVSLVQRLSDEQAHARYGAGLWEFMRIPGGAVYAVKYGAEPCEIHSPNGYSFTASPDVAGLCWSIIALCHLANHFQCERSYRAWRALTEWTHEHPEAQHIAAFLD